MHPVLNGGNLFRENLNHIKKVSHLFDKILVSITSPDEFPYDKESCIMSNIKNLELIEFNEKSLVKTFFIYLSIFLIRIYSSLDMMTNRLNRVS